jgi:hypothetical protein
MEDVLNAAFPEFVGGIMAVICAVIGAKIAISAAKRQERKKNLLDAYAELFSAYYDLVADDKSEKNSVHFMVSVERVRLLCSERSERLITELAPLLTSDPLQIDELAKKISQLREAAKEDLRHTGA